MHMYTDQSLFEIPLPIQALFLNSYQQLCKSSLFQLIGVSLHLPATAAHFHHHHRQESVIFQFVYLIATTCLYSN